MEGVSLAETQGGRVALPASANWIRPFMPPGVAGAYLLLKGDQPLYVGRSDTCLRTRLLGHEHLGAASHLVWARCDTARQAYHLESYWYDRLQAHGGLLNRVHPARPAETDEVCPFCAIEHDAPAALPTWPCTRAAAESPG
jgi:hypothetical protein